MRIGHLIDKDGYLIGDVVEGGGAQPDVTVICPDGLYRPRWDGSAWVEGMTPEEIDQLVNYPEKYKDLRRVAYPAIGDQLDALWKLLEPNEGTEAAAMKEQILAVKAAYPKPE